MPDRISDRLAKRFQLFDRILCHDAERRWKLRVFDAVTLQLDILGKGKRFRVDFGFKKNFVSAFLLRGSSPRT